jgi:hypothetical protein
MAQNTSVAARAILWETSQAWGLGDSNPVEAIFNASAMLFDELTSSWGGRSSIELTLSDPRTRAALARTTREWKERAFGGVSRLASANWIQAARGALDGRALSVAAAVALATAVGSVHNARQAAQGAAEQPRQAWETAGPASDTSAAAPASGAADFTRRAAMAAAANVQAVVEMPARAARALLALPVSLDDKNPLSGQELARKLLPKDPFLALATMVEKPSLEPYFASPAGWNIGMGYCITQRLSDFGEDRVKADFARAGIPGRTAGQLLSENPKVVQEARITQSQAVRLLMITKQDYVDQARKAVGEKTFDSLPLERQSALAYLSYNANLARFSRLPRAIAAGQNVAAMSEMTPVFKTPEGKLQKNYRLGSYLWAAWSGTLGVAIDDPSEHERLYANSRGLSAFVRDDRGLKKPAAAKEKGSKAASAAPLKGFKRPLPRDPAARLFAQAETPKTLPLGLSGKALASKPLALAGTDAAIGRLEGLRARTGREHASLLALNETPSASGRRPKGGL